MIKILNITLLAYFLTSSNNIETSNREQTEKLTKFEIQIVEQKVNKIIADKVYVGMTIQEMKDKYPDAEFLEEPVFEYGIDGESLGIVVREKEKPLFFVWTMLNDNRIKGITILSKDIIIDGNVHVGMTLEQFLNKYPSKTLAIDMVDERIEFCNVHELNYRVEFMTTETTRIAEYDFKVGEPEFIKVKNLKKRIDRISID